MAQSTGCVARGDRSLHRPAPGNTTQTRLLSRALLVALALVSLLGGQGAGPALGAPLAQAPPLPMDLEGQRQWLLQRNREQQQWLERNMRCLQNADSINILERCRQSTHWQGPFNGRMGPWPGCPMW